MTVAGIRMALGAGATAPASPIATRRRCPAATPNQSRRFRPACRPLPRGRRHATQGRERLSARRAHRDAFGGVLAAPASPIAARRRCRPPTRRPAPPARWSAFVGVLLAAAGKPGCPRDRRGRASGGAGVLDSLAEGAGFPDRSPAPRPAARPNQSCRLSPPPPAAWWRPSGRRRRPVSWCGSKLVDCASISDGYWRARSQRAPGGAHDRCRRGGERLVAARPHCQPPGEPVLASRPLRGGRRPRDRRRERPSAAAPRPGAAASWWTAPRSPAAAGGPLPPYARRRA